MGNNNDDNTNDQGDENQMIFDHGDEAEVWLSAWSAAVANPNVTNTDEADRWADDAVISYRERAADLREDLEADDDDDDQGDD